MTQYESDDRVEPARVTTYRHMRKALRRGWSMQPEGPAPSIDDVWTLRDGRPPTRRS